MFGVNHYRDEDGYLRPIPNRPRVFCAVTARYMIGIYLSEFSKGIYAIYDENENQIFLDRDTWPYKHVTEIPDEYKPKFVRLTPPTPPPSPKQGESSRPRSSSPTIIWIKRNNKNI